MDIERKRKIRLCLHSPADYIRLANKFFNDWDKVFDKRSLPKEVAEAIKLIGNGKTVAHVKGEKNHTHPSYEITSHQHKAWDFEAHREENGAYILEYHFLKRITYEKEYCGITHRAPEYMDVINAVNRQKGSVRYFCSRPPSPDWLPDGYVTFEEYPPPNEPGDYYPGEVTYDKPLASEQCDRYGLILDDKWAERRKAFASGLSQ